MAINLEKYKKATTTPTGKPVDLSKYKKSIPATPPEKGIIGTTKSDSLFGKLIDNSVTRGIQKYVPGAKVGQAIGTLGGLGLTAGKEALGLAPKGATKAYDTSAPSPLQVAGDVASSAATVAGFKIPAPIGASAMRTIGKTALQTGALGAIAGAGTGAQKTTGEALPTGQDIASVAKGAAVGGATGAAIGGITSGITQLLTKAGDKIMNSVIKPSTADIEDGFSVETIKKYDLGGSLKTTMSKTEQRMNALTSDLNNKLSATDSKINLEDVYNKTAKRLSGSKLSMFGSNASTARALEGLKAEIAALDDAGQLAIPDAQLVKRASGQYGAWTFGNTDPDATARQKVFNAFYNEMKEAIEEGSPEGVREINKQISELIPVMNAVIRRIPIAERNNILSLGDIITLSASAVNPSALGGFALNLASKSGAFGSALSKVSTKAQGAAQPLGVLGAGIASRFSPEAQSPLDQ